MIHSVIGQGFLVRKQVERVVVSYKITGPRPQVKFKVQKERNKKTAASPKNCFSAFAPSASSSRSLFTVLK